ncbi:LptF/LptG family permease, partial [Candidatus Pelagibacter sp.]|nr:LptF/LptG family permease [Candidatus Pelagibacter sp.]
LFEIFPFIFLLSTQFFFYELFRNQESILLNLNGLNNLKIIKILFVLSFLIGVFNVVIYYNISSMLSFQYSQTKNKFTDDNKYLAMVTVSGLWIKDEINDKILITKSELIKNSYLQNSIINEFDKNFELIRTIQSQKININQNKWIIHNPIISEKNFSEADKDKIYLETNFNEQRINNLFSNFSTLDIIKLLSLIEDYKKIGHSSDDVILHLLNLLTLPFFYGILSVLSAILMINFSRNKPIIFHIIFGILMSVIIYYTNHIFNSLASSGKISISISIFLPLLILTIFSAIGLIDINEK